MIYLESSHSGGALGRALAEDDEELVYALVEIARRVNPHGLCETFADFPDDEVESILAFFRGVVHGMGPGST